MSKNIKIALNFLFYFNDFMRALFFGALSSSEKSDHFDVGNDSVLVETKSNSFLPEFDGGIFWTNLPPERKSLVGGNPTI